jgi:hypothetical protein
MPTRPEENGCWLYGNSVNGVPLRDDVCAAANTIWRNACRKTERAMGDSTETGTIMEVAAGEASQYLDGLGPQAASANPPALLWKIFCRVLARRAVTFRRLQPAGRLIESSVSIPSWEEDVNRELFFKKLQHHLSPDSVTILLKRRMGHGWDEIARMLDTTATAAKKRFWREINNAKAKLKIDTQQERRKPKLG